MSFKVIENKWINLSILTVVMMISALNSSMLYAMVNQLTVDFNVDIVSIQLLISIYSIVGAVLVPLSAFLIKRFNNKKLLVSALVLFAIGSFFCGNSSTFKSIFIGRIIQSIGAGMFLPISINAIMSIFQRGQQGFAMGILGFGTLLVPAFSTIIIGYFVEYYSWNLLFYDITILVVILLFFTIRFYEYENDIINVKLDKFGLILITIGLTSMLYGIKLVSYDGIVSIKSIAWMLMSIVLLLIFVIKSIHKDTEGMLLNLEVFKDLNFRYVTILCSILQIFLLSGLLFLPIYLQTIFGFTVIETGIIMLPGSIILSVFSIIAGKIYDNMGLYMLLVIGLTSISLASLCFYNTDASTNEYILSIIYMLHSFGIAFSLMPLQTASMKNIEIDNISNANAIFTCIKLISSSVIGMILTSIVNMILGKYTVGELRILNEENFGVNGINCVFLISCIIATILATIMIVLKQKKIYFTE